MAFKRAAKCPYSVGQVIEFAIEIDPNSLYARTTWVRFAEGQTTIGYKGLDVDFGVVGASGGKKGHKMTLDNLIEHNHEIAHEDTSANTGVGIAGGLYVTDHTVYTGNTGQDDPVAIPTLPPFVVVSKWKRVA